MLLKTHRVNIMMTDVLVKKKKMAQAVWDLGLKVKRVSGRKTGRRDEREMLHSSRKKLEIGWKTNIFWFFLGGFGNLLQMFEILQTRRFRLRT